MGNPWKICENYGKSTENTEKHTDEKSRLNMGKYGKNIETYRWKCVQTMGNPWKMWETYGKYTGNPWKSPNSTEVFFCWENHWTMLLVSCLASQFAYKRLISPENIYQFQRNRFVVHSALVHPRVNCGRKKSPNWNVNDFDQKGQLHQQITATTTNKQVTTDPR